MKLKTSKRLGRLTLAIALALTVLGTSAFAVAPVQAANQEAKKEGSVEIATPDNKVPTFEYQKSQDFVLNITNTGEEKITNFKIMPKLKSNQPSEWPFKTEYQKYSKTIKEIKPGESAQVKFSFTQRDDAGAKRYTLLFAYSADQIEMSKETLYVNTSAKPEKKPNPSGGNGGSGSKGDSGSAGGSNAGASSGVSGGGSADADFGGGIDNSGAVYSDGGEVSAVSESGDGSVPRVIVTGFSTDPAEVRAGSDFTLTIHLKNTSKKSKVGNMLFDLNAPEEGDEQTSAPAFLPASGSSTVYLDGIKAGGTADISMKLNAKADLLQKPYSVELSMKYEDASFNQVETSSSLSIPVKQDARFEFSEFQISPESISVGEDANVMCSLYNMGRIKLYNVKAVFEGKGIEKEEVFIGNVDSGATASIDAMVTGAAENMEDDKVTMTMSYENEDGEVFTETKDFQLLVMAEEDMGGMDDGGMIEEVDEGGGFSLPVVIGVLAAVAAIVAAVILIKRRRHKKDKNEEEELLYELDGTSEDERE